MILTYIMWRTYHCIYDLLFDWFGLSYFPYVEIHNRLYLLVWLNPKQSNRRSDVQRCFPLQTNKLSECSLLAIF